MVVCGEIILRLLSGNSFLNLSKYGSEIHIFGDAIIQKASDSCVMQFNEDIVVAEAKQGTGDGGAKVGCTIRMELQDDSPTARNAQLHSISLGQTK
jgi:hypothetical protein